ncbi:MAG: phosphoribosylamine--glycine ligase [Firmicutes bacterium]|nr:phosphoribosylamine--glycine ligase [Bacillota bacterium]
MRVLVIGGGGREHSIVQALCRDGGVSEIFCAPGNAGIAGEIVSSTKNAVRCVDIKADDVDGIVAYVQTGGARELAIDKVLSGGEASKCEPKFDLVVVAPDNPLAMGLVDRLEAVGVRAFGPKKAAAEIESSKAFAKDFMKRHNIPTARYKTFDSYNSAVGFIDGGLWGEQSVDIDYENSISKKGETASETIFEQAITYPLVIKADGLALGKGVIIAGDVAHAKQALKEMMLESAFGDSGSRVVIEEFLVGREVSVLAFTDGKTIVPMPAACDYKRAYDNDLGANTGGMGTFASPSFFDSKLKKEAMDNIYLPTIRGLESEGREFKGVLFFGLMVTDTGIKVIEYNARFGDPETQSILPLLKTDISKIFVAVTDTRLDKVKIEWQDKNCVTVVLASEGYPENPIKNRPISINADLLDKDIIITHAGTAKASGALLTSGGRVLGVSATHKDLAVARQLVYNNIKHISFDGMMFRKDIAGCERIK